MYVLDALSVQKEMLKENENNNKNYNYQTVWKGEATIFKRTALKICLSLITLIICDRVVSDIP